MERHDRLMGRKRLTIFTIWSVTAAAISGYTVHTLGVGLMRENIWPWALMSGVFVLGLNWIRLPAPHTDRARRGAVLTKTSRRILCTLTLLVAGGATFRIMHQAQRGYPPLLPQEVVGSGPDVPLDYYTVDGRPALNYVYEMKGSEGEKYVLPLEEFDGYLLVMVDAIPKDVELSITGKLD